jgi:hypothetical protein
MAIKRISRIRGFKSATYRYSMAPICPSDKWLAVGQRNDKLPQHPSKMRAEK